MFIYSGSARLVSKSFEISLISKEISRTELEYMNIDPPPLINVPVSASIETKTVGYILTQSLRSTNFEQLALDVKTTPNCVINVNLKSQRCTNIL